MPHGITIAWDLFNSGGTDLPSIEVFCDGVSVGNFIHEAYSGGTFTLSNPVTGASTAAISYNATGPTVQTAMRLVSGWGSVTVTGNVGGPWTVDHVTVGAYTAPTANPASLLPAGSTLTVKTVRPGTASLSAKWSFPDVLTDPPLMDDGTFTLTNPATSLTTAPIAFNADSATVQAAMRPISGWTAVTVTGNAGGPWTVDHGEVGAYADPVSDASAFLPANSSLAVVRTVTGTASVNAKWTVAPRPYRPKVVNVHWDYDGLDVTYGGRTIFTNLPTPGFVPAIGDIFAFSARNESSNTMNFFLDDVVLSTTPLQELQTNGIVITEFMADNAGTLEDEDVDSPDWIEIYNGTNAAINLNGYRLTNAVGNNSMWTFPSVSLPSYTYKIIYASGKNRTVPTGLLHTNFTLQKEAGYLALIKPDGVARGLVGEVLGRIERKGFRIIALEQRTITAEIAQAHYAEHVDRPFFGDLVAFITSAPLVAAVIEGPDAILSWRTMMGATNPANANPGTIRGDLATETQNNVTHGSDSPESSAREIALFFPGLS